MLKELNLVKQVILSHNDFQKVATDTQNEQKKLEELREKHRNHP